MGKQNKSNEVISIDNQSLDYNTYLEILECFMKINREAYPSVSKQYIHYTSTQSFQAMLKPFAEEQQNYINLFASKVQFLNDSSEFKTGFDLVKDNYQSFAEKLKTNATLSLRDDAFTVSFCGEEDLLSQWKYYGKESGIAIEFDFGINKPECKFLWTESKQVGESEEWNYNWAFDFNLMPSSIIYGQARQKKALENIVSKIKKNERTMYKDVIITSFIPFCKNISFIEEKESRLLFYPISDKGSQAEIITPIKYWNKNGKIIPQFECRLAYCKTTNKRPPIPIKNIMVGPGYNQTEIFNGVISMLEQGKNTLDYIDDKKIKDITTRVKYSKMQTINSNDLCIVEKSIKTKLSGEEKSIIDNLEYVTYKTSNGITVQMSAIPFRS
ncbi:MAG: DUF2971 domain-containing protein [Clostridia bacterium]|nr:DUF2971 domain-containing protein [Clostridia bacterium]